MNLSQRIAEDRDAQLLAESVEKLEEERTRTERALQRLEIVTNRLTVVAESLGEECVPLGEGFGVPKYFQFGDFILVAQLFHYISEDELEMPDKPQLLVAQYLVALVGVDKRSRSIGTVRIGTLKFLDYQGMFKAVTTAPSYLTFDIEEVQAILNLP